MVYTKISIVFTLLVYHFFLSHSLLKLSVRFFCFTFFSHSLSYAFIHFHFSWEFISRLSRKVGSLKKTQKQITEQKNASRHDAKRSVVFLPIEKLCFSMKYTRVICSGANQLCVYCTTTSHPPPLSTLFLFNLSKPLPLAVAIKCWFEALGPWTYYHFIYFDIFTISYAFWSIISDH